MVNLWVSLKQLWIKLSSARHQLLLILTAASWHRAFTSGNPLLAMQEALIWLNYTFLGQNPVQKNYWCKTFALNIQKSEARKHCIEDENLTVTEILKMLSCWSVRLGSLQDSSDWDCCGWEQLLLRQGTPWVLHTIMNKLFIIIN